MKKTNIIILSVLSLNFLVTGCKPDDHTDFSTLVKNAATTVEINGVPVAMTINESVDDVVATITVSLSEPQIVDIHVPIKQIAGDAEDGADYELSSADLVFPAYTTGPQEFTLTILDDDLVESDETLKLQIGDELTSNANITPAIMDVTITNSTDLDLNMSFVWNRFYTLKYWDAEGNDTTVNTINAIDLDFYVFDEGGSVAGNDQGIYDAATGSHPERLTFTAPDQEGIYVISANLWANIYRLLGYGSLSLPQGPFPVTTTFSRKGVLEPITLVQDSDEAFDTNTEDSENDGANEFRDLFKVEVKPDMFIIYKTDGSEFATARRKLPFYQYHKHASLPRFR